MAHYQLKNDSDFIKVIAGEMPRSLLGTAIDWIRDNLSPDQVFEQRRLNDFVSNTQMPDEVFSEEELHQWAIDNGYTPPVKKDSILSYAKTE